MTVARTRGPNVVLSLPASPVLHLQLAMEASLAEKIFVILPNISTPILNRPSLITLMLTLLVLMQSPQFVAETTNAPQTSPPDITTHPLSQSELDKNQTSTENIHKFFSIVGKYPDKMMNESFSKCYQPDGNRNLVVFDERVIQRKALQDRLSVDEMTIKYETDWPGRTGVRLVIACSTTTTLIAAIVSKYYYWQFAQTAGALVLLCMIVIGNSSILYRLKSCRRSRSNVNYFIVQLAIADLLVGVFCVTLDTIQRITVAFNYGLLACLATKYISSVFIYSSSYLLVAMSIDRWEAVVKPLAFTQNRNQGHYLVGGAWLLACVSAIPVTLYTEIKMIDDRPQCWINLDISGWRIYMIYLTCTLILVPVSIISICYAHIVYTIWRKGQQVSQRKSDHEQQVSRAQSRPSVKLKQQQQTRHRRQPLGHKSDPLAVTTSPNACAMETSVDANGASEITDSTVPRRHMTSPTETSESNSRLPTTLANKSPAGQRTISFKRPAGGDNSAWESERDSDGSTDEQPGENDIDRRDDEEEADEDESSNDGSDDDDNAERSSREADESSGDVTPRALAPSILSEPNGRPKVSGLSANLSPADGIHVSGVRLPSSTGSSESPPSHRAVSASRASGKAECVTIMRTTGKRTCGQRAKTKLQARTSFNSGASRGHLRPTNSEQTTVAASPGGGGTDRGGGRSSARGAGVVVVAKAGVGARGTSCMAQQHGSGVIPKARIKTIKMTLVIVLAYTLCWSPFCIINLCGLYGFMKTDTAIGAALGTLSQSLAHLNSAVNPIIFWLFSSKRAATTAAKRHFAPSSGSHDTAGSNRRWSLERRTVWSSIRRTLCCHQWCICMGDRAALVTDSRIFENTGTSATGLAGYKAHRQASVQQSPVQVDGRLDGTGRASVGNSLGRETLITQSIRQL